MRHFVEALKEVYPDTKEMWCEARRQGAGWYRLRRLRRALGKIEFVAALPRFKNLLVCPKCLTDRGSQRLVNHGLDVFEDNRPYAQYLEVTCDCGHLWRERPHDWDARHIRVEGLTVDKLIAELHGLELVND